MYSTFSNARRLTVLLALAVSLTAWPAAAKEFTLETAGGFTNPLLIVGFNPQPEPPNPGVPTIDFSRDFTESTITFTGLEAEDFDPRVGTSDMEIVFFINEADARMGIEPTPFLDSPTTTVEIFDSAGFIAYTLSLTTSTSSGGSPLAAVAFNPQPEPPGFKGVGFMIDTYTSFSDVYLSFSLTDSAGNALTFTDVPGPAPVALLAIGLVMMRTLRRQRAQRGTS